MTRALMPSSMAPPRRTNVGSAGLIPGQAPGLSVIAVVESKPLRRRAPGLADAALDRGRGGVKRHAGLGHVDLGGRVNRKGEVKICPELLPEAVHVRDADTELPFD